MMPSVIASGIASARGLAREFKGAAICLFAGTAALAVTAVLAPSAGAADLKTIRFGMTPKSFVESAQLIAIREGIFEKNGLKVELVELTGDILVVRSLIAGDLDIATIGAFIVMNAVQRNAQIKAFVTPVSGQPHMLVTVKSIKDWKGLIGKNFAISEPNAISHTFPRVILTQLQMDPDKVNWLAIGGSGPRQAALVTGKVDAALLHKERAFQLAQSDERFHVVGSTDEYLKGVPHVIHAARTDWLANNRDTAIRFTKSIIEAVRFSMTNKEAMMKLGEDLIGKNPKAIEAAYEDYRKNVWNINGEIDRKNFDFSADLGVKTGELKEKVSYEKAVDTQYLDAVLKELGRK